MNVAPGEEHVEVTYKRDVREYVHCAGLGEVRIDPGINRLPPKVADAVFAQLDAEEKLAKGPKKGPVPYTTRKRFFEKGKLVKAASQKEG